ncbi:MAG TPA: hypothetical protein VJ733_13355, partial [Candidatus Binatia bacterium]|nr:hypothetical protein [Candidatus Binatia bacterium]
MITTREETKPASRLDQVWNYPFIEAIVNRRSRRFSMGATMNGGGLAYTSPHSPAPLTNLEEAILVTAATGVTGHTLADLPYQSGAKPEAGGGNVMASFNGRTVASADGIHGTALFVLNDEGTFLLRRPQDLPPVEIVELSQMTRERRLE